MRNLRRILSGVSRGFLLILFAASMLVAGQTGKIFGKITDKKTGDPIIGASVLIEGTKTGASSDFEGDYSIGNVTPGTYTLLISSLGYRSVTIKNVMVKIDLTTTIDLKMEETVIEMGEGVVIEAERPLVQKDLTSSSVTVSSDEMKVMPVENIQQVINLQAGVVGGHFRGGRSGEVAYLVDGIPVNNPLNGGAGFTPENAAIREMEVISGTFNAEYGQAMSGIVNIVTMDGASDFHGSAGVYVGDYYTNHTDVFENLDKVNFTRIKNYQLSLSGPTMLVSSLSFFLTGRLQDEEGYLYGKRIYNLTDPAPMELKFPDQTIVLNYHTGDSSYVSMNPFKKYSFSGKVTYAFDNFKVSFGGFWEKWQSKGYSHDYRWAPDGIMNNYGENWMQNIQINHIISNDTYQSLKFAVNKYTGKGYVYSNPYDPRYLDPDFGAASSNYTFRHGGNQTGRYENRTQTMIGQWSITSQVSKEHKIGLGGELKMHSVFDHGTGLTKDTIVTIDSLGNEILSNYHPTYPQPGTLGNQQYTKKPIEFAAYVQDKMEYGIMIVNAGIRFDYFDPNSTVLYDLKNPLRNPNYPDAGRMKRTTVKYQFSPRLGISFPITDQGIIHFSYGHFFQIPSFGNLYQNSNYLISQERQLTTTMGNPDLQPQRTVTYELGLQQELFTNIGIDVTMYYRDIRNLLGSEIIETHEALKYARYVNRDYGNVRGFIFSVEKRFTDYYSLRADYTYQIAEGNASDPLSVYYNNQSTPPVETNKKVVPLDWDQRSTFNLSANVGEQGNWNIGLILNYGAGFPYTEDITVAGITRSENNGVKPYTYNVDLRMEKNFSFGGLRWNTFLLVYNLLDIKNEVNVDTRTGRANTHFFTEAEGGPSRIIGMNTYEQYLNNPTSFSTPRNFRVGFNLEF
ncbi:MAG: TonB-dependent receptor [Bacteroidota bacterium]